MPTPQFTPGARIFPINLTAPAFQGLTLEASGSTLGPEWATALDNAVFDSVGRPASRKGFTTETSSAGSAVHMRIFEYYKADGTRPGNNSGAPSVLAAYDVEPGQPNAQSLRLSGLPGALVQRWGLM